MKHATGLVIALVMAIGSLAPAIAQGTQVAFGALTHDTSLPVEISADQLVVDQADGSASFSGNVMIGQGEMRLSAGKVRVEYASDVQDATGRVSKLIASEGVTLVNGAEAAEAGSATYDIDSGVVVMTGSVILTQGRNALSSDRMVINLKTGIGTLEGRVRTILQTDSN